MRFVKNDEFENLPEITSISLVNLKSNKFDPDGIFSNKIFGYQDYSCKCGALKAAWNVGSLCPECGTTVEDPKDNIYKCGKLRIPLDYYVINPIIFKLMLKYIPKLDDKINPAKKHIELEGQIKYEENDLQLINFIDFSLKYEETIETLLPDDMVEGDSNLELLKDFLLNNKDYVLMKDILVIPIHLRPADVIGRRINVDPLNARYIAINTHIQSLKDNVNCQEVISLDKELYSIQNELLQLYTLVIDTIAKKEGLARDQILSNTINLSGRAVITLNHDNNPEEIKTPRIMFTEVYFPLLVGHIANILQKNFADASTYYYLNRFNFEDEVISTAIADVLRSKPVALINRNPSLHLLSIQAFYISEVTNDYTIKLPKTCLQPLSGDFDADFHFFFV